MCCKDSSNVIRQCNNICVYNLTFVRISHIKTTLETNAQTQIFGSCVTGSYHTLEAITHFLQHPFVKENFVKINTKLLKIMLKLGQNKLILCLA